MALTPEERIQRGEQAQRALDQFLTPAFDHVFAVHMQAVVNAVMDDPSNDKRIRNLSLVAKLTREAQAYVKAFVLDGEAAMSEKKMADRTAGFSPEKTRWAKMAGGLR